MEVVLTLMSVLVVSLISVVVAIPLLITKKISNKILIFLLSMSVGVLLSTVFLGFFPEISHDYTIAGGLYICLGFMVMFVLEKFIHYHHNKDCENGDCGHGHAYNLAPINLIGDGIHNFIDGLLIAGSYTINTSVGIAATISIIFHEIPQEIADFGVLLYSGMSRKKAILFNLLSAMSAILGAVIGLVWIQTQGFAEMIIPFAAGNFIYIAASNLVPQLHRHCTLKDSLLHIFAIVCGIAIILVITVSSPHMH